ncbi:acyltransferase [Polymorphobacter multimanifer]|uniref:acyltransferase family protein n=1 Tax=Polymorphobacter multimanifer TaxID=1070431 RepID=UPI00166B8370|nr:acyltransferase [Polymorphobacter multimanifer]GGI67616.1 acyltransferase [Polymorphobacter multimanifer]
MKVLTTLPLAADVLPSGTRGIPALTGIRGVAACWVVLYHIGTNLDAIAPALPVRDMALVRAGYLGVDLFFLLSGYVLAHSYFRRADTGMGSTLQVFWIGRVFRIMPLNTFMLLLLSLLATAFPAPFWSDAPLAASTFWACLLLVQSWGFSNPTSWNFPAWSLSAEWAAYEVLPLILLAGRYARSAAIALAAALASLLVLVLIMLTLGEQNLHHVWLLGLPRCLLQFAAGAFLWRSLDLGLLRRGNPDAVLATGLCGLAIAVAAPGLDLVAPFAFAAIIIGCAMESRLANRLFANSTAMFLGSISFSIYLSHAIIINGCKLVLARTGVELASPPAAALLVLTLIGAILAVSTLTWRLVERPGQDAGRWCVQALGRSRLRRRKAVAP